MARGGGPRQSQLCLLPRDQLGGDLGRGAALTGPRLLLAKQGPFPKAAGPSEWWFRTRLYCPAGSASQTSQTLKEKSLFLLSGVGHRPRLRVLPSGPRACSFGCARELGGGLLFGLLPTTAQDVLPGSASAPACESERRTPGQDPGAPPVCQQAA